jgi:hypothetical protein
MSMAYIRRTWGVPAKRGMRIVYCGKTGVITGASGPHLRIRLDHWKRSRLFHPTWEIEYPTP